VSNATRNGISAMVRLLITDGVSQGPGQCVLLLQPHDEEAEGEKFCSLMLTWSAGKEPKLRELDFVAAGIVKLVGRILVYGRLGRILDVAADQKSKITGPNRLGFLSDMRVVEEKVYAVGAWRQVYVSNNGLDWSRFDDGTRDEIRDLRKVTGFRAIDGTAADNLYAVGRMGEIWYKGENGWSSEETPTNVILELVRIRRSGAVFAAGQLGVVLRGRHNVWEVISGNGLEEDFWGLEEFRGRMYLSSHTRLFGIEDEKYLVPLPMKGADAHQLCRLRAGRGALWSFGLERAFWTEDGETWQEAKFGGVRE
jgi:hypothetical protein